MSPMVSMTLAYLLGIAVRILGAVLLLNGLLKMELKKPFGI